MILYSATIMIVHTDVDVINYTILCLVIVLCSCFANITQSSKDLLNVELQEWDIRAIYVVLLFDLQVTYKTSIRGVLNGDQTVDITDLGTGICTVAGVAQQQC